MRRKLSLRMRPSLLNLLSMPLSLRRTRLRLLLRPRTTIRRSSMPCPACLMRRIRLPEQFLRNRRKKPLRPKILSQPIIWHKSSPRPKSQRSKRRLQLQLSPLPRSQRPLRLWPTCPVRTTSLELLTLTSLSRLLPATMSISQRSTRKQSLR